MITTDRAKDSAIYNQKKLIEMDKAEQILEKHINENDLNFIFHEKKDLWQELVNATNEALGIANVVGALKCTNCETGEIEVVKQCCSCGKEY